MSTFFSLFLHINLFLVLIFMLKLPCLNGANNIHNRPDLSSSHHGRKHIGYLNHRDLKLGRTRFTCRNVQLMLRKKQELTKMISHRMSNLIVNGLHSQDPAQLKSPLVNKETDLKVKILKLYQAELNASEEALHMVLVGLNRTLSSDYRSLDIIRFSCEARLAEMQTAALIVEGNHNDVLKLVSEAKMAPEHLNSSQGHHKLMNDILAEISHAADKLEKQLREDIFSDLVQGKGPVPQGAEIETVVKLGSNIGHYKDPLDQGSEHQVTLVDSLNNQYTLSRPRDLTVLIDDPNLVKDIVILLVVCSLLGAVCCLMGLPPLFGYGVAGMILGPAGYNIVKSVVQVETIGEFGAVFIIFMAGLEFSLDKLKKVFRFSMYCSGLLLLVCIVLTLIIGLPLGMKVRQCFFVAVSLSLSSATMMNHLIEVINSSRRKVHSVQDIEATAVRQQTSLDESESNLVASLQGIMVIQDIQMASLVALMPFFASSSIEFSFTAYVISVVKLIQILLGFFLLLVLTHFLAHRALEPAFKILSVVKNKGETLLLGSLTICFLLLAASIFLGASLELGCFLAGVAITTQGSVTVEQIKKLIEPIRELFAAIFFASVGFHVFPTFLLSEFFTIFSVTFCVVLFKLSINFTLIGYFTGYCRQLTWLSALSMAQVSEFSFVLCSRARRLRIITRETYLVLLSVTALSLILSPILWRLPRLLSAVSRPRSLTRTSAPLVQCFDYTKTLLQRRFSPQSKPNM